MAVKHVKTLADITMPDKGTVDIEKGEDVLRIPIKVITQKLLEDITNRFRPPAAPVQWRRNPNTGDMEQFANENDPAWKEEMRNYEASQTKSILLAGLDLELPGETDDEKWGNLASRFSIGEMNALLAGIMELSKIGEDVIEQAKKSLSRIPAEEKVEKKS